MNGLFAAFGPLARRYTAAALDGLWPRSGARGAPSLVMRAEDGFLYRPCGAPRHRAVSSVSSFQSMLDGYVFSSRAPGGADATAHLAALHSTIEEVGPLRAYDTLLAGAFNLGGIDCGGVNHFLLNDHFGTTPLYCIERHDGVIACTNPVVLAAASGERFAIDTVATAEWILLGYALGDRHFLRSVRVLAPGTLLTWSREAQRATQTRISFRPLAAVPEPRAPDIDAVADALETACARIQSLDPQIGHLQSGGMDSRAILAAWPSGTAPRCYTYGRPESAEVHVAREVAMAKNAPFVHWTSDGDAVGGALEQIFDTAGMLVYPDRFLIARQMAEDGVPALLDGFLGDVLVGGSYFHSDRYGPLFARLSRFLTVLVDQKVASVGLDQLSEMIYDDIVEYPHSLAELAHVLDADVIDALQRARPEIVSDIRASLERVRAADDSTAITFRNFLIASRGLHAIGLQGVLCREHVEVYYPFTNDVQLLSTLLQLPPTRLAYRRFYIELFRRRYPKFAALPVDSSGLPLRRGPLAHKWAVLLRGMGIAMPGLRSVVSAQHVPPVHWGAWLQQSETLRQALAGFFAESPLVNRSRLDTLLTGLANGDELGGGELPQIAAISRWYAIAAHVGSMQGT